MYPNLFMGKLEYDTLNSCHEHKQPYGSDTARGKDNDTELNVEMLQTKLNEWVLRSHVRDIGKWEGTG